MCPSLDDNLPMKSHLARIFKTALCLSAIACSSTIKQAPPSQDFVEQTHKALELLEDTGFVTRELTLEQKWAQTFLEAKSYQKKEQLYKACQTFRSLEPLEFPLEGLLQMKILETCSFSIEEFKDMLEKTADTIRHYSKETFYNIALKKSKEYKTNNAESSYWGKLARFEKTNEAKVAFIQNGLKLSTDSNLTEQLTSKLHQYAPRFIQDPKADKWFKVARDFERVRNFSLARAYYQKVINSEQSSYAEKVKTHWRLAMSFKVGRDKEKYTESLVDMTKWLKDLLYDSPSNEQYAKDFFKYQILVARSYWTLQNSRKAMTILSQIAKYPQAKGNQLANIYWLIGSVYLERKKYDEAVIQFQKAFEVPITDNHLRLRISWSLPWTFYSQKKYPLAIHYFEKAISRIDDEYDKVKYKFWLAKSLEKIKKNNEAKVIYKDIIENSKYGYYGILSHNELDQPFDIMEPQKYSKTLDNELSWLVVLDEHDLAKSYLKAKRKKYKAKNFIGYLPYYLEIKDYPQAMSVYFSLPSAMRHQLKNTYDGVIFPMPFLKEVKAASEKFKISSSFIYSIMRQESAFDPEARSWADAFGLLQLLPKLAKSLSKRAGVKVASYTDLYHPDTNIKLGARHLKDLQVKKKNKFVLYVSSYNASERAVNHWLKTRYKGDYLEFIERIPYKETRNYVKLVLRNYINYRRGLSDKTFYFPNKFFTKPLE
jgi:soluble lytic murein transglycosylase